ncbi:MAG: YbjQ family protein [Lachnospiraceae bacterium]|nr:YbjQ family protein [Lachnospiraceae bacterium]
MAIICCVCGKKQSGWITDYPLGSELENHRICAECGEKYHKIQNAKTLEDVFEEINYFKEQLAKGGQDEIVNRFFDLLFKGFETEKTFIDANTIIAEQRDNAISNIMVTSGYDFEGYKITKYCDFISAEAVFGMGMFKALLASVSSMAGAESEAFNKKIKETKAKSMYDIRKNALELGANAIIGLDIDFSTIASDMVVIIASGTAVIIEETK